MNEKISLLASRLTPLRIGLAVLALLTIIFAPAAGTEPDLEGWRSLQTLILPALAPLVMMVILLDTLMARVHMIEKEGEPLAKYRTVVRFNLVLVAGLVIFWAQYFIALFK